MELSYLKGVRLKRRAGIYSREEFNLIVDDYFFKTQDEKIYSINWDRYFIFLDVTEEAKIDGHYITAELVSIIFDVPIDSVKDYWSSSGEV